MKTFRSLITLAVFLVGMSISPAAVPSTINYQGRLTDASGTPLAGNRVMSVKVYDSVTGGAQLYSETLGNVPVDANGIYGFQFGANGNGASPAISSTLGGATEHWLEITVDGVAQQPRQKLQSVPFALVAKGLEDGSVTSSMIADGAVGLAKISGLGTAATANAADFVAATNAALAGVPTGPTAAPGTNSSQLATTAFVLANGGSLSNGGSLANVVYAKNFGVIADGVTNDTAALQAAIDSAAASASVATRATVVLPRGMIRLSKTFQTGIGENKQAINLKSNVNLVGQGIGATVLKLLDNVWENTPTLLAYDGNAANIMVSNLTIDGNAITRRCTGGSEDEGLNFKAGSNIVVSHVEIKNVGQDGIDLDAGTDIMVTSCIFLNNFGNGIHAVGGGPSRVRVTGCSFIGNGFVRRAIDGASGAGLDGIATYLIVTGCTFKDNAKEIECYGGNMIVTGCSLTHYVNVNGVGLNAVEASSIYPGSSLELNGCQIVAGVGNAIGIKNNHRLTMVQNCQILGPTVATSAGKIVFTGNVVSGSYGVHLISTSLPALISSNYFEDGYTNGLRIEASAGGTATGNHFGALAGGVDIQFQSGSTGWQILSNKLAFSSAGIQSFSGGGGMATIVGNSGGFDLSLGASGCLIQSNQLDTVTLQSGATSSNVFESNVIGGVIIHTGATFASNTWRRNSGAGCVGVFYGTASLASGTAVITTAAANASRKFAFNRQSANASTGLGQLALGPVIAQTSFTINSLSSATAVVTGDASTVFWEILE